MRRYVLCVGKSGVGSPGGVPLGVYPDTLAAMEARPSRCGWDTVPRTDLGGNAVLWRDVYHDDPEAGDYYAVYQVEALEAGLPPPPLTPADREAALAEIQKLVQWAKHTSLRSWAAPMERLCWLLGLTPQERGFVQALAEGDATALPAFVDWLGEQGRDGDARFIGLAAYEQGIEAERRRVRQAFQATRLEDYRQPLRGPATITMRVDDFERAVNGPAVAEVADG
jgi:hypothetical protein